MIAEYADLDALALRQLIESGEVSPGEVVASAIGMAEQRNGAVNAIVTPMYESAVEVAAKPIAGPLAGVPFLVKDLTLVKDVRCSMGSRLWSDFVPDHDADIVSRYRKAGLVIMGKSNTPEVGLAATTESVFLGPCRNPWDLSRTTGGSSGGAAAAVAAGIVPVAHATDGGGSIRIPASCCGLVGLKPTRARTPLGPDVGEGWGAMASGHVVSRTVRDSAAFLDATHGPALGDPYHPPFFGGSFLGEMARDPGRLRIAVDLSPINGSKVHPDCVAGVEKVAAQCVELGHDVSEVNLEYDRELVGRAAGALVAVNLRHNILARAEALGVTPSLDLIEAATLRFVEWGGEVPSDVYVRCLHTIHAATRVIERFLLGYDLILSPTLLCPPPKLGFMDTNSTDEATYAAHFNEFWGFTSLYNATGNPAISLPLHWTDTGLPIGIQFAAGFGNEVLLLQIARQLEEAMPWRDRRAPVTDA